MDDSRPLDIYEVGHCGPYGPNVILRKAIELTEQLQSSAVLISEKHKGSPSSYPRTYEIFPCISGSHSDKNIGVIS